MRQWSVCELKSVYHNTCWRGDLESPWGCLPLHISIKKAALQQYIKLSERVSLSVSEGDLTTRQDKSFPSLTELHPSGAGHEPRFMQGKKNSFTHTYECMRSGAGRHTVQTHSHSVTDVCG